MMGSSLSLRGLFKAQVSSVYKEINPAFIGMVTALRLGDY
jgi:hypothetical protein